MGRGRRHADRLAALSFRRAPAARALAALLLAVPPVACGGGGALPTEAPPPMLALEIVSGDEQMAPVETSLRKLFVVRVKDAIGRPVPGVLVTWSVASGEGELSVKRPRTDPQGLGSALLFTGPAAGAQVVVARVEGGLEVRFRAHATSSLEGNPALLPR